MATPHAPKNASPQNVAPPEIRQLPDHAANQIAAGEVIERPAAVVKELVENALDAGATRIVIRLDDGGRRLVEIEDNGHGMKSADLRLAVARHATSKLRDADDLFRIATLGFRGEALPSIAAVSEMEIASRPAAETQGYELKIHGGNEMSFAPCAMASGTRISVRNLFWNVPARLKFLKSEAAESGHVTDQVMRLALSHPAVAFRLDINGRSAIDLPNDEALSARIRALFGTTLSERLLPISSELDAMALHGFVAHPQEAKPTSKRQFLFLNGRFIKDRIVLAAVRDGFKGFLEPRLHGTVFLHLEIDPSQVDVNVHPTKSEVRFRREGEVFALIRNALQNTLAQHAGGFSLLPSAPHAAVSTTAPTTAPFSAISQRTIIKPAAPASTVVIQERYLPLNNVPPTPSTPPRVAEKNELYQAVTPALPTRTTSSGVPPAPEKIAPPSTIKRVLQLHRMYLLIEHADGIRLVDQHALHEKALLHVLDPALSDFRQHGIQQLLVPIRVELLSHEIALIEPLLPQLATVGIDAVRSSATTIAINAYPALLKRTPWARFFTELIDNSTPEQLTATLSEKIRHSTACHSAIKAGQELSHDEQWELARLFERFEQLEHCPHGRPTTLELTWAELAHRFQRG
jgi:DNA mismatch repair protein MutL